MELNLAIGDFFVEIAKFNSPIANSVVFCYTMWPLNRQF